MILERTTSIRAPLADVFRFFSLPANLGVITPPWLGFTILSAPDRTLAAGDRIIYRIRLAGIPMRWVTLISDWREGESFTDSQEKGPYRKWVHTHSFEKTDDGVLMRDRVDYELPFGTLGRLFGGWLVRLQLKAIFEFRERKIREIFG